MICVNIQKVENGETVLPRKTTYGDYSATLIVGSVRLLNDLKRATGINGITVRITKMFGVAVYEFGL